MEETKPLTHYQKYKETIIAYHRRNRDDILAKQREYQRLRYEKLKQERELKRQEELKERELFENFKALMKGAFAPPRRTNGESEKGLNK